MIVQTCNTRYVLEDLGDGAFRVSGHSQFCPTPTEGRLWEAPKVGESMRITFNEGPYKGIHNSIRTSAVQSIEE